MRSPAALLAVALSLASAVVVAKEPGVKVSMHSDFFQAATAVALKELHDELIGMKFPDCNNCANEANHKFFEYYTSNVRITGVTVLTQASHIVPQPPGGLMVTLAVQFRIDGNWKIKGFWGMASCDGTLDATGKVYGALNLQITRAADGRPHAVAAGASGHAADVSLAFHGDLCADIAHWAASWLEGKVTEKLNAEIPTMLKGPLVNKLNEALAKMDVSVELSDAGAGIYLDYTLSSSPLASATALSVPFTGEIYYSGHADDPNVPQPSAMAPVDPHGRMLCVQIAAMALLNQLNYAAQLTGLMKTTVGSGEFLKCTCEGKKCIGGFIKQLAGHCGTDNTANVSVQSTATGEAIVASESIFDTFSARVNIDHKGDNLLAIDVTQTVALMNVNLVNTAKGPTIIASCSFSRDWTYNVTHSAIGDVGDDEIKETISFLQGGIKLKLDPILQKGFVLPGSKGALQYENPLITVSPKVLTVCADLRYVG